MRTVSRPTAGKPLRATWCREVADAVRSQRQTGGSSLAGGHVPFRRRPPATGMDWSLFPFGSIGGYQCVVIFPGYFLVDGRGTWRLPADSADPDYTKIEDVVSAGYVILRAPRITPESAALVFQVTPANVQSATYFERPICRVAVNAKGWVDILERSIGNKEIAATL